jgi:cell division protein FtsI (penicillin-binding protein 3)
MLIDGSYSKKEYNASFVGFFPAEQPKIAILIQVSSPSIGRYGGQVAAPIFKRVAESLIEADLSLVPEKNRIERRKKYLDELLKSNHVSSRANTIKFSNIGKEEVDFDKNTIEIKKDRIPNLVNMSVREAVTILNDLGLTHRVVGSGFVKRQSIKANSLIKEGQFCLINCEAANIPNVRLN